MGAGTIDISAGLIPKTPSPSTATPSGSIDISYGLVPKQPPAKPPSTLSKVWEFANKPLVSAQNIERFTPLGAALAWGRKNWEQIAEEEKQSKNPVRAKMANFMAAAMQVPSQVESGLTSPVSAALAATPYAEASEAIPYIRPAVRGLQGLAAAYFGRQGLANAVRGRLPGETQEQEYNRKILGTLMTATSVTGEGMLAKDKLKTTLEKQFGLNQDLAGRVASHMAKLQDIQDRTKRAEEAHTSELSGIAERAKSAGASVDELLSSKLSDIQSRREAAETSKSQGAKETAQRRFDISQRLRTGIKAERKAMAPQMLENLADAVAREQVRLGNKFDEVGKQVHGVLANAKEVKAMIVQEVTDSGASENEIPKRAFAALRIEGQALPASRIGPEAQEYIRSIALNRGEGAARAAAERMHVTNRQFNSILSSEDLHFNDLNRVRRDIMDAVNSTDDTEVQNGLREAYERISEVQDEAVEKASPQLKREYLKAKDEYTNFKRNTDGNIPGRLLAARNAEKQVLAQSMLANMSSDEEDVIGSLAKAYGVDTSGWKRLKDEEEALKTERSQIREGLSEKYGKRSTSVQGADAALKQLKEEGQSAKESASESHAAIKSRAKEETEEAKSRAKESGKSLAGERREAELPEPGANAVVPGIRYSKLAGMTSEQLRAARFEKLMDASSRSGMTRAWRLGLAVLGLVRLLAGEMSGGFEVAIGGGPTAIDSFLKSDPVKRWLAREGGVEDRAKFDKAYKSVYPKLRKVVRSAAIQAALGSNLKKLPPPPAPAPPFLSPFPTQ